MQSKEVECLGPDLLDSVAMEIIHYAGDNKVWIFEGEMGAGKTTLIRAICRKLGVLDNVCSPTFSIVNEYATSAGGAVYHFDFYRLRSEAEALDLGYEEYFYSDHLCLVEWPSKIASLIPDRHLKVEICVQSKEARKIRLSRQH